MVSKNKVILRYVLVLVLILATGIGVLMLLGPVIGNVFSTINTSLVSYTPIPPSTPGPGNELSRVDEILNQAMSASIAYNAPSAMQLDETVIIQLLLNPSVSEGEIAKQIEESGAVTTGTVEITPLMKAELKAQNGEAFVIEPLHDTSEQPVSASDATRWQWQVTARKGGVQGLTLVLYRLVKYENKDYWREVETYKANITVKVSLAQRFQSFDWKWLGGILLTSIVVPLIMRWLNKRKRNTAKSKKAKA